ncbi:MAG: thiamine-monophosphate kinase [Candidatus Omnitrophica bacterium]|nr:thiamine-monophosphate kinase [Candidatus Omnitrophota bacterium]
MDVRSVGEFGLIKRFCAQITSDASVKQGPGDDCAVLAFNKQKYLLFTCDMIVEGQDFTRDDPAHLIGRKALAISISDIAACGGIPRHAVVSLGLPAATSLKFVDNMFKGMRALAKKFSINIVGGDISKAHEVVIDVSMLGEVEKEHLVLRRGAKPGDIFFVTGPLGGTIKGKHLDFTPRLEVSRFLVSHFSVHAMIDISDGLVQDLKHILKASGIGARIDTRLIPVSLEAGDLDDALTGGEDFELLFALSRKDARKLLKNNPFHCQSIGEAVEKKYGCTFTGWHADRLSCLKKGFQHF